MEPEQKRRTFTVREYLRMARMGILKEEERIELINGEIVQMSPIGTEHAGTCAALVRLLTLRLQDRALVWAQNPVRIKPDSMPQPDVAVLKPREDHYRKTYPVPEDILFVLEISDSSLAWDRVTKARLYAKHEIPEYWIVNLRDRCLELYRRPTAIGYEESAIFKDPGTVRPLAFPDVELTLADILG